MIIVPIFVRRLHFNRLQFWLLKNLINFSRQEYFTIIQQIFQCTIFIFLYFVLNQTITILFQFREIKIRIFISSIVRAISDFSHSALTRLPNSNTFSKSLHFNLSVSKRFNNLDRGSPNSSFNSLINSSNFRSFNLRGNNFWAILEYSGPPNFEINNLTFNS
ncbi:hypothetical protein ACQ4LE_002234 [Meloidogyne hapla]